MSEAELLQAIRTDVAVIREKVERLENEARERRLHDEEQDKLIASLRVEQAKQGQRSGLLWGLVSGGGTAGLIEALRQFVGGPPQ